MTYKHLTPNELVMIEAYFQTKQSVLTVSKIFGRSRQTIYNVYNFLKKGLSANDYYQRYKENKTYCGRRSIILSADQQTYIQKMTAKGWTPDVIIGRAEIPISCSVRTLYRLFKANDFDITKLPMKGKRKPNGHNERRGLNENSNGILRRNGLPKKMDFNQVDQNFISAVASKRNHIPRKIIK
ncbi:transposase, partial [Brochothrix campestris FSL F6-1037]